MICDICMVFQTTTALGQQLKQVALCMISSSSPVCKAPWLQKRGGGRVGTPFAPIELQLHPAPEGLLMDIASEVETAQRPAQRGEGFGEAIGRGAAR